MKKISKFAAILTALALALTLAACSHPNSGDDSSGSQAATTLDGTYSGTFTSGAANFTLNFYSNGTLSVSVGSTSDSGTYSIDGTSLSGSSGTGNSLLTYSGTKHTDTTWKINVTDYNGGNFASNVTITKQ